MQAENTPIEVLGNFCGNSRIKWEEECFRSWPSPASHLRQNRQVSQEVLPVHRRNSNLPDSGRVTGLPEVIPQKSGSVRIVDNPGTK